MARGAALMGAPDDAWPRGNTGREQKFFGGEYF